MLTPAKDDPNYKIERERQKKNPGAFGVVMGNPDPNLPTSGGLVPAERGTAAVVNCDAEKYATELKAWAEETAAKSLTEIAKLLPTMERTPLECLIAAEKAGKQRKNLLDELNSALTKLL